MTDPMSAADFPVPIGLTGGALDRADHLRDDPAALARLAADPRARLLLLQDGKASITLDQGGSRLCQRSAAPPPGAVFLGVDPSGGALFAASAAADETPAPDGGAETKFIDLRSIAGELPDGEAAIYAEAKSLLAWHATHRFCAQCGAPTALSRGGWRRDCPACGARHFPRTDPVVIMLVLRRRPGEAERVLLGRQHGWPDGLHSLLAGYVEPGETIHEAVRRETREESGVEVGAVRIVASQPWPFPSTLMIGCVAEALTDALTPDPTELETCMWVGKTEMQAALGGDHSAFRPPRPDAIARALVAAWAEDLLAP